MKSESDSQIESQNGPGMAMQGRGFTGFALTYAFRNLWRNSRRTLLTIATVLLSVGVTIVANRYSIAILKLWEDGAADTGTAHVQIHAKGYWQKQEGVSKKLTLQEDSEMERTIRADPKVLSAVRRLEVEGIVSADDLSVYFLGNGVEPVEEMIVSPRLFTRNDEGVFVDPDNRFSAVVGKGLSESINLGMGEEATLITQTLSGSVNGVDIEVKGIVDAAIPSFSKRIIYTNIGHLQRLLRMPDRYTELAIRLKEGVNVETWIEANRGLVESSGAEIRGWWDVEPVISKVKKIWNSVVAVVAGLLFLSAALSVLNIIYMLVAERTTEIGTLMAVGAKSGDIRRLFALEAALIGLIGGVAGVIAGNITVVIMHQVGVPFDSPFSSDKLIVRPELGLTTTVVVFVAAVIICYVAAVVPARRAALVEPVKAFRGQVT